MTPTASPIRDIQDQINDIVLGNQDITKSNKMQTCPNQVSSPVEDKSCQLFGGQVTEICPEGSKNLVEEPLTHDKVLSLPLNWNHLYGHAKSMGWERRLRSMFCLFGRVLRQTGKREPQGSQAMHPHHKKLGTSYRRLHKAFSDLQGLFAYILHEPGSC